MSQDQTVRDLWDNWRDGIGCPVCARREPNNETGVEIARLSISTLYLFRDQRFRGYAVLVFDPRHACTLEELNDGEYDAFMRDLRVAAAGIHSALNPDHMNYECLGNSNPHLHWQIVPRYKNDPRWGQPIWEGWQRNEFNIHPFVLTEQEYARIIERIRDCLEDKAHGRNTRADVSAR